jgi:curved DNA-binding protein CbpA
MDSDAIRSWLAVLDDLSYYELLGVPAETGADGIRQGFYRFAADFHPDGHAMRPTGERTAINTIFKRGTEAYRVLSDPALRSRYDYARPNGNVAARQAAMAPKPHGNSPSLHVPPPSLRPPTSPPPGSAATADLAITGRLEDYVRRSRARPFAQQAEQLAKRKEFSKAKLQLKLAMNMDPGNPTLEQYLKELDQELRLLKSKSAG